MHILNNAELPHASMPGIDHVTLAGSAQGLRQLSVWQQVLEPGSATPPHRHDCEEVVLCSAGRGEIHVDGREVFSFAAGTTVCVPRNALHQIFNSGSEPLGMVAIFSTSPVDARFPDGSPIKLPWTT
ncbi:MAG: cupin domain-containing protein [Panacagrimonas sp.]